MLGRIILVDRNPGKMTKQFANKGLVIASLYVCFQSFPVFTALNATGDAVSYVEKEVMVPVSKSYYNKADILSINLYESTVDSGRPAEEYYTHWNSDYVHPYPDNMVNSNDTITLSLNNLYECSYVHPIDGRITSGFGYRRGSYHDGVDIDITYGEAIFNSFDGKVRVAKYEPSYGYVVVVRHYNGLETVYGHLSKLAVDEGDVLRAGMIVGHGGNTGESTGTHLHYEMRFQGQPINPAKIVSFEHRMLKDDTLAIYRNNSQFLAVKDASADIPS